MNEPKFTPEPWHVEKSENDFAVYVIASEKHGNLPICRMYGSMDTVAQDNASLIAAAPEMYAELEKFVELCYQCDCEGYARRSEEILRKARGESEVSE